MLYRQLPLARARLHGTRRSYSVKFSENFDGHHPEATKPKIRDFRYPLFHTFLIASATYMGLNAVWSALEYKQVEKDLSAKSKLLEEDLQAALDAAKHEMKSSQSVWSKLAFWRKS